ncbi:MAG TPA: hypothetical protein VI643_08370 [Planctomycetota bacterium]|nr:hypothetical protein [Planctomycetota bacterium]
MWAVVEPALARRIRARARATGRTTSRVVEEILLEHFAASSLREVASADFRLGPVGIRLVARCSEDSTARDDLLISLNGAAVRELRRRIGDARLAAALFGGQTNAAPGLVALIERLLRETPRR